MKRVVLLLSVCLMSTACSIEKKSGDSKAASTAGPVASCVFNAKVSKIAIMCAQYEGNESLVKKSVDECTDDEMLQVSRFPDKGCDTSKFKYACQYKDPLGLTFTVNHHEDAFDMTGLKESKESCEKEKGTFIIR